MPRGTAMNLKNELFLMLSNNKQPNQSVRHLWRVNKVHIVHDFHPKVI